MKITMLGTGHAVVTKYYNTCFTIDDRNEYFLVDGGGGSEILRILEEIDIPLNKIHNIFVSHAHTDHLFGVIWVVRMIGQLMCQNKYQGVLKVYCHEGLEDIIRSICGMVLADKVTSLFDERIMFVSIKDGECFQVLGCELTAFVVRSDKMKQYGFIMNYNGGKKIVFCGDEPLTETMEEIASRCDWLLHEAFCLYSERDIFKPYEKAHSTVKDACELAERLKCKNLLLFHTEDSHINERQMLYKKEGMKYFSGMLHIPNDREIIEL